MQLTCDRNMGNRCPSIFNLQLYFEKKNRFFCKRDFSGYTNDLNFKVACEDVSQCTNIFLQFSVFPQKNLQNSILHRCEFACAASLQPTHFDRGQRVSQWVNSYFLNYRKAPFTPSASRRRDHILSYVQVMYAYSSAVKIRHCQLRHCQ